MQWADVHISEEPLLVELLEMMLGGLFSTEMTLDFFGTYLKYEWCRKKESGGFDGRDFQRAEWHRRVQTKRGQRARADPLG